MEQRASTRHQAANRDGILSYRSMAPKLRIRLRTGWRPADNPAVPTYKREASSDSGALQFSVAQFRHGTVPNATEQTLVAMCENLTMKVRGRRDVVTGSGPCELGMYGTMAVRGDFPVRFQAWVLSNGQDFILVTHTCGSEPDPEEIRQANEIALMTGYG